MPVAANWYAGDNPWTTVYDLPMRLASDARAYDLFRQAAGLHIGHDADNRECRRLALVVGIMPPGFDVHDQRVELWLPATIDPANPGNRGGHFLYVIARLRNGVGIGQARAELDTLMDAETVLQWLVSDDSGIPVHGLDEIEAWTDLPEQGYTTRGGAIVAWRRST